MNLQDIFQFISSAVTPNEAGAEVVPQDPYASALVEKMKADPRYRPIYNAAQARPEKVNVSHEPELLSQNTFGIFRPNAGTGHDYIGIGRQAPDRPESTLAHELVHYLINYHPQLKNLSKDANEYVATHLGEKGARATGDLRETLNSLLNYK